MNEMIKELKENWTAFGGLSEEKREFLKANWSYVERFTYDEWIENYVPLKEADDALSNVYRLRPDFGEKQGRWVEYPIENMGGVYSCNVKHAGAVVSDVGTMHYLHQLPSIVGFGGVQYEGQRTWKHKISSFVLGDGVTVGGCSNRNAEVRPATPIKARFWVEG